MIAFANTAVDAPSISQSWQAEPIPNTSAMSRAHPRDDSLPQPFWTTQELQAAGLSPQAAADAGYQPIFPTVWLHEAWTSRIGPHYELAAVQHALPDAIVSHVSALTIHEVGTDFANDFDFSIPPGCPAFDFGAYRGWMYEVSAAEQKIGVVEHNDHGLSIRLTSLERTLCDCLRPPWSAAYGLDSGRGYLEEALALDVVTPDRLQAMAERLQCQAVVMDVVDAWRAGQ